ncbi:hypothetical protein [Evansella clarkii]|uniref:hypothetical protein n=1 Tax=Evansella clarkii TaxID=79879 RepID=UPI0009971A93|nr:hypothetical protein [Evansella clarkii]
MLNLEHPTVERINRTGYPGETQQENVIAMCPCGESLKDGDNAVEFQDRLFCDEECLTEAFCDNPGSFGMEKTKIS